MVVLLQALLTFVCIGLLGWPGLVIAMIVGFILFVMMGVGSRG